MKKNIRLVEATRMYENASVHETENSFLVNMFGKYQPNITFVLPKSFDLGKDEKVIDPLSYVADEEVTSSMNVEFKGKPEFLFGDFWLSRKGGACFRPKDPLSAQHLLVRVEWGGATKRTRGNYSVPAGAESGVLYFRHAASNGGGSGYDYWVVPVGFSRLLADEGEEMSSATQYRVVEAVPSIRRKHHDLQEAMVREGEAYFAEQKASTVAKPQFIDRLMVVKNGLVALGEDWIEIKDDFFRFGWTKLFYNEENVQRAERLLQEKRAERQVKLDARAEFEPDFEAFRPEIESYGWALAFDEECARVKQKGIGITYKYDAGGLEALKRDLEAEATRLATERAAKKLRQAIREAKAFGLPSNVRIWRREGATNAGYGWVITPSGMDRPYDRTDNGYDTWEQILMGELVLAWEHECTAAPHEFYVIYRPDTITEAQLERVAEIQESLEERFFGKRSLSGKSTCPSIGQGWGFFHRDEPTAK